ncbi:hypothetical protein L8C07_00655 [Paenibacillus sp. CMAA1739]|nr:MULTISPECIES: hypothetical protein [Paenibacillus]MDP1512466.1 hypothetical protein [Paenibacillus ottowii]MEC4564440.1 hypothetical protein [Paenibacillus sp. CMAA1739]
MSVHDDGKKQIYKLDNKRFAILHSHAILTDLARAQAVYQVNTDCVV